MFPKLVVKKIIEIYNMINNKKTSKKPKINMTTKSPLRNWVIILMRSNNLEAIIYKANKHILQIYSIEISQDFRASSIKTLTIRLLGWLTKVYRVHGVCFRKPKLILITILKIRLTSRKPKKIEQGFCKKT